MVPLISGANAEWSLLGCPKKQAAGARIPYGGKPKVGSSTRKTRWNPIAGADHTHDTSLVCSINCHQE